MLYNAVALYLQHHLQDVVDTVGEDQAARFCTILKYLKVDIDWLEARLAVLGDDLFNLRAILIELSVKAHRRRLTEHPNYICKFIFSSADRRLAYSGLMTLTNPSRENI